MPPSSVPRGPILVRSLSHAHLQATLTRAASHPAYFSRSCTPQPKQLVCLAADSFSLKGGPFPRPVWPCIQSPSPPFPRCLQPLGEADYNFVSLVNSATGSRLFKFIASGAAVITRAAHLYLLDEKGAPISPAFQRWACFMLYWIGFVCPSTLASLRSNQEPCSRCFALAAEATS